LDKDIENPGAGKLSSMDYSVFVILVLKFPGVGGNGMRNNNGSL